MVQIGGGGGLLAMVAGGPHRGTPPFTAPPEPALLLDSADGGQAGIAVGGGAIFLQAAFFQSG